MTESQVVGPVEIAVFEFPGSKFNGDIVPAIIDLIDSGTVAVLDIVVVARDPDDTVSYHELWDLDEDQAALFEDVEGEAGGLLSEEDITLIGDQLEPGSTAVVFVWENTWARPMVAAIQGAEGRLVAHDRIDAETVARALQEVSGG
jgi:hypothetical protein